MRSGIAQRVTNTTGRRANKTANQTASHAGTRSASTQSGTAQKMPKHRATYDQDSMVLDVRFYPERCLEF